MVKLGGKKIILTAGQVAQCLVHNETLCYMYVSQFSDYKDVCREKLEFAFAFEEPCCCTVRLLFLLKFYRKEMDYQVQNILGMCH